MRASLLIAAFLTACGTSSAIPFGADRDGGPAADGGRDGGTTLRDAGVMLTTEVTFSVTVPVGTPSYETIHVTGDAPELGAWDGRGFALSRITDRRWEATRRFAIGLEIEFKVTRGSWDTVEKDAGGGEIANRRLSVEGLAHANVEVAAWRDRPRVTGDIVSLGTFGSALLADRPVLVYLPPGYAQETTRRYPVLYFHDGQNLFDGRTAFGGVEWGLDETAEALIQAGAIEPLIIVAVGNTADRIDEYTHAEDPGYGGGDADLYGRLLVEELKPVIDALYRTDQNPERTGVAGSSLGGLVSIYLGLTHAGTFRRIGVISPSVWWSGRDIVARVEALGSKLPLRIWEDIGTAEGSSSETVADARALRDALAAKGWRLGEDLAYTEVTGAGHNEAAWAARIGDVLRFLFPAR